MALAEKERNKIRRYLGWPGRYLSTDSALQRAILSAEGQPQVEADIRELLGFLDDIDSRIRGTAPGVGGIFGRLKASSVGPLQLDGAAELSELRSIGRQYTAQIATLLGVEVRFDVWGGGSPTSRSGYYGPGGGGKGRLGFG